MRDILINLTIAVFIIDVSSILIGYCLIFFYMRLKRIYTKKKINNVSVSNKQNISITKKCTWGGLKRILLKIMYILDDMTIYFSKFTGRLPSNKMRRFLLKHFFLIKFHKTVKIYGGFEIRDGFNIEIGKGSIIGNDCILDGRNGILIGENVNLSSGVWIWSEQHDINDASFSCGVQKKVIIEDRVWLSARTMVLPGRKVAEGSVVAAGAIVTKDTEPYSISAGIPAKKIRDRNNNLNYELSSSMPWFL